MDAAAPVHEALNLLAAAAPNLGLAERAVLLWLQDGKGPQPFDDRLKLVSTLPPVRSRLERSSVEAYNFFFFHDYEPVNQTCVMLVLYILRDGVRSTAKVLGCPWASAPNELGQAAVPAPRAACRWWRSA
jgi:hypothetical protein